MKEHGILFSAPMVKALLARRKTVTRRMSDGWMRVKAGDVLWVRETWGCPSADHPRCKDGRKSTPGDKLVFAANEADAYQWQTGHPGCGDFVWRPSIFMPRWASRITLIATEDARREPLQDITEEDAIAEGIENIRCSIAGELNTDELIFRSGQPLWRNYALSERHWVASPIESYRSLWDSLHGKTDPWSSNPSVARLAFRDAA